ncbi:GNAT family N-acetyltransferase [Nocardia sp. NPDC052566]|uniref:GNAT family N-acetyltransferase n=1 Tax=Nocardia sp. NPDC052566 TaxID=3364330 RepID=UPI0037C7E64E
MITVRRIDGDEWKLGRELRLATLTDSPEAFKSKAEVAATWSSDQWREWIGDRAYFVAELDGTAVGAAAGSIDDDGAPVLVSVWVAPTARGTGASAAVVRAVVAWARAERHAALRLWVMDGNARAESLYLRLGFRRTGQELPCPGDDPRIEVEMSMAL